MIRLPDESLDIATATTLRTYQAEVDAAGAYPEQVAEAKRLFVLRNVRGNATFGEIKRVLDRMCAGARRCAYCEDSLADEVEHVRPKDLYPQVVFAWSNYVYACGPCNGPKSNHFAVFVEGSDDPFEVARSWRAPVVPPIDGAPVLLDPRTEDAAAYMWLDLRETFFFAPSAAKGTRDYERAAYTIKTLQLNQRDALPRARREAYKDYLAHIRSYAHERDKRATPTRLLELRTSARERQHPTVWREMVRQRELIPELRELFAAVPEAATW